LKLFCQFLWATSLLLFNQLDQVLGALVVL